MIKSITHKGLKKLFNKGVTSGVNPHHATKLKMILALLNAANEINDVAFPGSNLHPLTGELADHWSVKVNGNWRITFKFIDGDAYVVDYQDYH